MRYMEQTGKGGKVITDRPLRSDRLHGHNRRDPKENWSQSLALRIRIRHSTYTISKLYLFRFDSPPDYRGWNS